MKKPDLDKIIDYCHRNIPEFNYYEETEYEDKPLLIGDWWVRREDGDLRLHNIFDFIEDNYNVEISWHDEWTDCCVCYKAIGTSPTNYGWQPSYLITNDGYICKECCEDEIEYIIDEYKNNCSKAVLEWTIPLIENEGFNCFEDDDMLCSVFQNGLHRGMNDTPEKVIKSIEQELELDTINDMYDYIFAITSTSQFYLNFTIYLRPKGGIV